ncbi:MAG: hypothetical protein V1740_03400 [Candidatus Woesearchaeota archaeon]
MDKMMILAIGNLIINKEKCEKAITKEMYATEEAYNLVKKGESFRQAYNQVSSELNKK